MRALIPAFTLIFSALLLTGCCCGDGDPSSTGPAPAPAERTEVDSPPKSEPVEGGALNRFFPDAEVDGHKRVFTKEKDGFAEALLKKDGKEVATLTISDTNNNPKARSKFDSPDEKIQGHPVVKFGKNGSSALVADRYQVKVTSRDLDHGERKVWLGKFDLSGLAGLR